MSKCRKKIVGTLVVIVALLVFAFLFRFPLMRAAANFLISEDEVEQVDAIFILSGSPWNRGNEAAKLFKEHYSDKIICTGEYLPWSLVIVNAPYVESELTKLHLNAIGIPEENVTILKEGTSTFEESNAIIKYCKQHNFDKICIVTSNYHTRRVRMTFEKKFKQEGITVVIRGADSSGFDELRWWETEEGMIALNNEYMKLLYYVIMH